MKRIVISSRHLIGLSLFLFLSRPGIGQEEKSSPLDIGADIMSRYVWRGTDYGASPSIQPYIDVRGGNLNLGAWGAYTTNLPGIQEMDLYVSYTIKDLITVTFTDYFFPDEVLGYDYYEFRKDMSDHILEGLLKFNGTEKLPLTFMAGINICNDDHHSVYFETGYTFPFMDLFIGAGNGIYTTNEIFNLVNIGIKSSKDIPITEKYSLPVSASLITNPQAGKVYLVFGISF